MQQRSIFYISYYVPNVNIYQDLQLYL